MSLLKLCFALAVVAASASHASQANVPGTKIQLFLPSSLESQRRSMERDIIDAHARLQRFAVRTGWGALIREPFMTEARVFDSKEDFDTAVVRASKAPAGTQLKPSFVAALENGVLMVVSPALIAQINPKDVEPHFFQKLIAHELAHRLHVRVLKGNEEAMGPVWFYEGFAVIASGQYENSRPKLDRAEIERIMTSAERGDYRKYASALEYFLKRTTLPEMVRRAADNRFSAWLKKL